MKTKSISAFIPKIPPVVTMLLGILVCLAFGNMALAQGNRRKAITMEVGVARTDITPEVPIRLAGYAVRAKTEAVGVLQRLSAKALALGSDQQHPTVLITVDLVGIPWRITKQVSDFLSQKMGIDPAQIAICASHTHGGPEVGTLINILQYRGDHFNDSLLALSQLTHIAEYTEQLTQKLKDVAMAALKNRKPAYVSWGQGQALFAANRRTKGGPVDVALPMLKITRPDGSLRAVFVSYACHGTTMGGNINKIHGDWIGQAQADIEARHPGAIALIALGCAGDANPAPRGSWEDVKSHGKEIADNVDKLLTAQLQPLDSPPVGKMEWIKLPLAKAHTVPELIELSKDKTVKGYEARLSLERVERGKTIPSTIDYPVQVWNFENKMAMVNLGGEVVVDYAILLKDKYGAEHLWINAYSNHVPCYIPSRRILKEGGYEGETNMYWYDQPSPFDPEVENVIVNAVDELMPSSFKQKRPVANHEQLIQKGTDNIYHLSSWLAGTTGSHIKYMQEWKAFGWFTTQDQASWKVNIEKKGRYDVYLVYSVSDGEAGKHFVLVAGNKKLKGEAPKTGSWFTYKTIKAGAIRLSPGEQDVALKSNVKREKGSMFDLREVRLVPVK
jgi:hypothetical protein